MEMKLKRRLEGGHDLAAQIQMSTNPQGIKDTDVITSKE